MLGAAFGLCAGTIAACGKEDAMYGLIGKIIVKPGQRDALVSILLESTGEMPGCRIYLVATDPGDANAIWITEAWDSEADHQASLQLPQVQGAIARARPLIEGFGERFITTPVGGVGLDRRG
jgi:quinol monooxygenase YgiN